MSVLKNILNELNEKYIVDNITKKHDEARIQYTLKSITVEDDTEFDNLIADYYNYQFTKCVSFGGELPRSESAGRAKELLFNAYKRKGKNKLNAYSDGKTGTNGGMRQILDLIMEYLKAEAVENHIRDVIDRYIAPSSSEEQVSIIGEIIRKLGIESDSIDVENPERYARNYEELIRGLIDSINQHSALFRKL